MTTPTPTDPTPSATMLRRVALGAALVLALVAGIVLGFGSTDDANLSATDASSASTPTTVATDPARTGSADGSIGDTPAPTPAPTPTPTPAPDTDPSPDPAPAPAATPSISAVTLRSSLECGITVAPQVLITVDGGTTTDSGTAQQQSLDVDAPLTVLTGRSIEGNAGTEHSVSVSLQEHLFGFFSNTTQTTAGTKTVTIPASADHVQLTYRYDLAFADGDVTVSDVVLSVTGCQEIVVPELTVSVVNGNGTVTPFIETGSSTQLTLVPGQPLVIADAASSGIDPADINRVEVRLFEHMFGRVLHVGAEDDGVFTFEVEQNNPSDPTWILEFTVSGLV